MSAGRRVDVAGEQEAAGLLPLLHGVSRVGASVGRPARDPAPPPLIPTHKAAIKVKALKAAQVRRKLAKCTSDHTTCCVLSLTCGPLDLDIGRKGGACSRVVL